MNKINIKQIFEQLKTEQVSQSAVDLNKNSALNQASNKNQPTKSAFSVTSAEQNSATAAENMANPTSAGTNNTVATTYNSAVRTYNLGTSNALTIQTFTSPQFGGAGTWAFNTHAYAGKYGNSFYYSVCTIDVAALAQFLNVSTETIINSTLYFENFVATGENVARIMNASGSAYILAGSNTETIQLYLSYFYNPTTGFIEFLVAPNNANVQGYFHFIPTSMNIVYPVDLSGITVTTPPNKTFYLVGETFESEGMVVSKIFSDGSSEVITDGLQFKRTGLSNEDVNFKISYGGKDTYLNLSLVEKSTVNYANSTNELQTMDIYVPVGLTQDVPAVITIHGGNWCGGGRSHYNYMTEFLTQTCGCIHVNMDYRLTTGQYVEGGITYRHMLKDISSAITLLTNENSPYPIDSDSIALMGHSAGGHLALLYAYMAASGATVIDPDDETKNITLHNIQLVISEAGPIEFKVQQVISLPPQNRNEIYAMAGISSTEADLPTKLDAVSPSKHVTSSSPYTILAYGFLSNDNNEPIDDGLVPIAPALYLYDLINNASISSSIEYGTSGCLCPSDNGNCVLYYFYKVHHNDFSLKNKVHPFTELENSELKDAILDYYDKINEKLNPSISN